MTHCGTINACPQGGGSQVRSSLSCLCPMSDVYGVFSNRKSPSISGEVTNGNSNSLQCFGSFLSNLDQQLKRASICVKHNLKFTFAQKNQNKTLPLDQ